MKLVTKLVPIILLILLFFSSFSYSQPGVFLWGIVKWNTGYPASGVEVRLVNISSQAIYGATWSNESGHYAFFNIPGQPSEFLVQVYTGTVIRGKIQIPNLPTGSQVPDIVIY